MQDGFTRILTDLLQGGPVAGGSHGQGGLLGELDKAFSLQSSVLDLFALVILLYAVVEGVEAVGLWFGRRLAEYLALLVTASLLPLEIYELTERVSPFKAIAFVINVAVVVYLPWPSGCSGCAAAPRPTSAPRRRRRLGRARALGPRGGRASGAGGRRRGGLTNAFD